MPGKKSVPITPSFDLEFGFYAKFGVGLGGLPSCVNFFSRRREPAVQKWRPRDGPRRPPAAGPGPRGGHPKVTFGVDFRTKIFENFEMFPNRPESPQDGSGMCLGAFWRHFQHLASVIECAVADSMPGGVRWRRGDCLEGPPGPTFEVDFRMKIFEKFEMFPNRPESPQDGSGMCLGAFWRHFQHLLSAIE